MATTPKPFDWTPSRPANTVGFKFTDVDPPSPLYIQRDDNLALEFSTLLAAGDIFTVTARLLLPAPPGAPIGLTTDKEIEDYTRSMGATVTTIQQTFKSTVPTVEASGLIQLSEGYLLSVAVNSASAGLPGQSFVRLWINRGGVNPVVANAGLLLLADSPYAGQPVSWPYGRSVRFHEGPGADTVQPVGNPAAGADFSFSFGTQMFYKLVAARFVLATDATAGNRNTKLRVSAPGAQIIFETGNNFAQVPSSTIAYNFGVGVSAAQVDPTTFMAPLPDTLRLAGGATIASITSAKGVADQFSAIVLWTEQWVP